VPVKGAPTGWPVAGFHNRTEPWLLSSPAEVRSLPSALNATAPTHPVWPVKGAPTGWRVARFQPGAGPTRQREADLHQHPA
jgi:hypothetical protein